MKLTTLLALFLLAVIANTLSLRQRTPLGTQTISILTRIFSSNNSRLILMVAYPPASLEPKRSKSRYFPIHPAGIPLYIQPVLSMSSRGSTNIR